MQQLAIIGSGIAGLGSAWFLHRDFAITVFEAGDHIGGHTHTVSVDEAGRPVPIDTGFMVFNHVTYPHLVRLFAALDVPTKRTDMSFSVRHGPRKLEFCGSSLNRLFAQRRNVWRPSFYRLLFAIDRFNREAVSALDDSTVQSMTLGEYVARGRYGHDFLGLYLLPMSAAVWSAPPREMLQFPAITLLRFFHNHGFLGLRTQHPWWTVAGGARTYVEKLTAPFRERIHLRTPVRRVQRTAQGVEVATADATQRFDKVIMACHPPTTLSLLGTDATSDERRVLSSFRYQPNSVTLHNDAAIMPHTRAAWSAWNYRIDAATEMRDAHRPESTPPLSASTHYWMNALQGVSRDVNYFVSLNGEHGIDPAKTLRTIACEHPLFDLAAREAQEHVPALNAAAAHTTQTYFAGAWQRFGFHEDGLLSAIHLAELLLRRNPWDMR